MGQHEKQWVPQIQFRMFDVCNVCCTFCSHVHDQKIAVLVANNRIIQKIRDSWKASAPVFGKSWWPYGWDSEHFFSLHSTHIKTQLVGGLEYLDFHMLGIIIPADFHMFQRG